MITRIANNERDRRRQWPAPQRDHEPIDWEAAFRRAEREAWEDFAIAECEPAPDRSTPRWLRLLKTIATAILALGVIVLWWLFWLELP